MTTSNREKASMLGSRIGTVVVSGLVGLVLGGAIGWWAGSYTACAEGPSCEVRVQSIEALGTWVGGLGTIAAVLAAVIAFQGEERSRRKAEHREIQAAREEERRAYEEAQQVTIACALPSWAGEYYATSIVVIVKNELNTVSVFKLEGELEGFGELKSKHQVGPGETLVTNFNLGPGSPHDALEVRDRTAYIAELASKVFLRFEMNGRAWSRKGTGPVSCIE